MNTKLDVHPVDEVLPLGKFSLLGIQHVLVMYAGAVAVPLIIGGALKLPKEQLAILINADLFACGLVTLIQSLGIWRFGIRLPVMMGVTFAAVSPMIVMATNPDIGLLGIYGAVISAGIFGILVAPVISRMLPAFPPVVTGSIITSSASRSCASASTGPPARPTPCHTPCRPGGQPGLRRAAAPRRGRHRARGHPAGHQVTSRASSPTSRCSWASSWACSSPSPWAR